MAKKQGTKSKRQVVREQRRKRQQQQRILTILIVTAVALVVVGLLVAPTIRNALTPVGEIVTITPNPRPMADDNAMGDPNAPVEVVEFSDYQCPFCAQFAEETEPLIVKDYVETGKVYFVYRSFGNFIGAESTAAAEAAYCAGEQNKYWEYHDILFANHTGENVGDYLDKRLTAFAESLGLNMGEFEQCMRSNKFADRIEQDRVDGTQAGVQGTPGFLINGKLIKGALPYSDFQVEIEAALAATGS